MARLDDRWGVEQSAKGTRFKLNRDLVGYHLTSRAELREARAVEQTSVALPLTLLLCRAGGAGAASKWTVLHRVPR